MNKWQKINFLRTYINPKKPSCCGARGEKNINWKGGVADYKNHYLMKKLRLKKLESVKYRCESCGGKAHLIHHKNKIKSDQRIKNFMALCWSCHKKKYHNSYRKKK